MLMTYILLAILVLGYLIYKLLISPFKMKTAYVNMFRSNGYKVYQYPYSFLGSPFFNDLIKNLKLKGDVSYSGKHIYSDSYDVLIGILFSTCQVIFLNEKLIKAFHDKDIQMKTPKITNGFRILRYSMLRGIIFIQKNVWKHRRRILSKLFNFDFIASQIPVMTKSADMMFDKFEEEYWVQHKEDKNQRKIKITLYDMIAKYTSSIIMAGFLGMDSSKEQFKGKTIQQEIMNLTDQSLKLSWDPFILMFGQKFLKLGLRKKDRDFISYKKEVNSIILEYIKKQRQEGKQKKSNKQFKTIIQLVLQQIENQCKDQAKGAQVITDQDLVDDIKTFILAGTDTTSNYLTMLLLLIYEHPHVLERLRSQISQHIKSDEYITIENIKKIKYFDFVLAEGSRLFGAAETGFERVLQEDTLICDLPLKKGTFMNVYTRPLFNNPKIFKDPLIFKPQRWQIENEQNKQLLQLLSLQFYGGPRGCIGKHLALTQTKVGIIKFLNRYKLLVEPQKKNRRIQLTLVFHIANSHVQLQKYQ